LKAGKLPVHPQNFGHPAKIAGTGSGTTLPLRILSNLSPISLFSLALGYGATGILIGPVVPYPLNFVVALAGGLGFNFGIVQPLMGYLSSFATRPSDGLEGTLYQEAEAITGFDAIGRGIVRLTLDGQHIQLLATLDQLEVEKGIHVKKGEKLLVIDIDAGRNSCRVTRELAS
jgi:hypothetical protein